MTNRISLFEYHKKLNIDLESKINIYDAQISFWFSVRGLDFESVIIEPLKPENKRSRQDGLWERTCFELFWNAKGNEYFEMNLSPAGDWQIYAFKNYREGRVEAPLQVSDVVVRKDIKSFEISGVISGGSTDNGKIITKIHPTAVLKTASGPNYFAPNHPPDKPDFHDQKFWTSIS